MPERSQPGNNFPHFAGKRVRRRAAAGLGELNAEQKEVDRLFVTTPEGGRPDPKIMDAADVARGLGIPGSQADRITQVVRETRAEYSTKGAVQNVVAARGKLLAILRTMTPHMPSDLRQEVTRRALSYWKGQSPVDLHRKPAMRFGVNKGGAVEDGGVIEELIKARYLKRVPTGNPKRPWRYIYSRSQEPALAKQVDRTERMEKLVRKLRAKFLKLKDNDGTEKDYTALHTTATMGMGALSKFFKMLTGRAIPKKKVAATAPAKPRAPRKPGTKREKKSIGILAQALLKAYRELAKLIEDIEEAKTAAKRMPGAPSEAQTRAALRSNLQGTKHHDKVLSPEKLDQWVDMFTKRVQRAYTPGEPSTERRVQREQEAARTHAAAERAGDRMGVGVLDLVFPDPSRDATAMTRMMMGLTPAERDRISVGLDTPAGWWEPVKPIQLGEKGGGGWHVDDGNHRLQAAVASGAKSIRVKMTHNDGKTSDVILPVAKRRDFGTHTAYELEGAHVQKRKVYRGVAIRRREMGGTTSGGVRFDGDEDALGREGGDDATDTLAEAKRLIDAQPDAPAPPPALGIPKASAVGDDGMTDYQRERKERAQSKADRLDRKAKAQWESSKAPLAGIPMGQPILAGHHSQQRHERAIATSTKRAFRALETSKDAQSAASAVHRAGSAISSNDPDAVEALNVKLGKLEAKRDAIKAHNKGKKKSPTPFPTPEEAKKYRMPSYVLSNLGGEIRRLKKRIEGLHAAAAEEARPDIVGEGFTIEESKDDNRIRFHFDKRPNPAMIRHMKRSGFKWSRSEGAWQRQLNNSGRYAAESAAKEIFGHGLTAEEKSKQAREKFQGGLKATRGRMPMQEVFEKLAEARSYVALPGAPIPPEHVAEWDSAVASLTEEGGKLEGVTSKILDSRIAEKSNKYRKSSPTFVMPLRTLAKGTNAEWGTGPTGSGGPGSRTDSLPDFSIYLSPEYQGRREQEKAAQENRIRATREKSRGFWAPSEGRSPELRYEPSGTEARYVEKDKPKLGVGKPTAKGQIERLKSAQKPYEDDDEDSDGSRKKRRPRKLGLRRKK